MFQRNPPKEFFSKTGYQFGELKVAQERLFDEDDNDYWGVLTYETEEAPRIHRKGIRRWQDCEQYRLEAKHVVHEHQVEKTFHHDVQQELTANKETYSKVMNMSTIKERALKRDIKTGKVVIAADSSNLRAEEPLAPASIASEKESPRQRAIADHADQTVGLRFLESELGSVMTSFAHSKFAPASLPVGGSPSPVHPLTFAPSPGTASCTNSSVGGAAFRRSKSDGDIQSFQAASKAIVEE